MFAWFVLRCCGVFSVLFTLGVFLVNSVGNGSLLGVLVSFWFLCCGLFVVRFFLGWCCSCGVLFCFAVYYWLIVCWIW